MAREIRVGVVGAGNMGTNHAQTICNEVPEAKLIAVADKDFSRAETLAGRWGVKACRDVRELVACGVDAVIVTTPTRTHREVAGVALEEGKHTLVEKPLAADIAAAQDIVDLAAGRLRLAVGHVEHFNPAVETLMNIVSGGELGQILMTNSRRVGPHPPQIKDTGVILDLGVHEILILTQMLGMLPNLVFAAGRAQNGEWEDLAGIILKFSGGITSLVEVNWLTPTKLRTMTAIGEFGVADVNYQTQTVAVNGTDRNVRRGHPLKAELQDFVDSISDSRDPRITGAMGVQAVAIATATLESMQTHSPVTLADWFKTAGQR